MKKTVSNSGVNINLDRDLKNKVYRQIRMKL